MPSSPYNARKILTWRPGTAGYVAIESSSFTHVDSRTASPCEHYALINKLYGYTDEVTDCATADYSPVGFDTWPLGDTTNGGTVMLRYSDECDSPGSKCYILTNSNDGMLHVFSTSTGDEISAVIPGELWGTSDVNYNQLREIMDQPNLEVLKRYYFDGGMRLFHRDENTNGYIDGTEKAYVVAGLGRAGRAYYLWNVSGTGFNGDFSSTSAPQAARFDGRRSLRLPKPA